MAKRSGFSAAVLGLLIAAALVPPAGAQAPDPALQAAMRAFDALPEAERKAIQTDLIWTGHLNSTATGTFGPLTFRAVNAFKGAQGSGDGLLAAAERQALARAAQTARTAAGFVLLTDERSGVRLGIPQKLLTKRDANTLGGSRWQSADQRVTLDTSATPPGETLPALFEKATAPNPNIQRRVTYKLLRPDFFVIAGETPSGKFYRRVAGGPAGLRGVSVGYDKALAASFDRVVTAIADSFEPFPGAGPAKPGAPPVAAPARPDAPRLANERAGTGLVVAPNLVLTARAAVEGCKSLKAAGKPATLRTSDAAGGLALLDVAGLAGAERPALAGDAVPASGEGVLALAFFRGADGALAAVALPGEVAAAGANAVSLPLQPGQAGSPVFDRQGRLLGLVAGEPPAGGLVAGIAPQRRYALAGADALRPVLAKAEITLAAGSGGAALSTGAIVARNAPALVAISCAL